MIDVPILAMSFILNLIAVLFVICCIALILIILVQKGKGGGLSSAFGGGMTGGVLGTKTGDFLTWVTIILVGVMLLFAIILAKFYKPAAPPAVPVPAPITTTTTQPSGTPAGADFTGQDNGDSGSALPMMEPTDIVEPDTTAAEGNENGASDSNQPGN